MRNANIRAELYLGNPKNMGNQLKYADRRNAPCVIIQGSDEKARGEIQIKDLISAPSLHRDQGPRGISEEAERSAVPRSPQAQLVDEVREVLARHDVKWG